MTRAAGCLVFCRCTRPPEPPPKRPSRDAVSCPPPRRAAGADEPRQSYVTDGLAAVEYLLASGGNAVLGTNLDFTDRRLRRSGLAKEPSFVLPSGYKPFSIGGLGNFPYYWRDPGSFSFNETTYGWITAALKAGCMPVQLDEVFTNRFLSAFGRISYSLSTKEGSDLRGASEDALDKQSALLEVWQSAFDTFPPSDAIGSRPIDLIMIQITQTWRRPQPI
jgi:hypothetical protein